MYSRVTMVQQPSASSSTTTHRNAILQDVYDIDDEDDDHSNEVSLDNFYDAQGERIRGESSERDGGPGRGDREKLSLPDVKVSSSGDPTDRLIEAIESLREVIIDNTYASQKGKKRGQGGGGSNPDRHQTASPRYKANGTVMSVKDERLKIRKDKVGELKLIYTTHLINIMLAVH